MLRVTSVNQNKITITSRTSFNAAIYGFWTVTAYLLYSTNILTNNTTLKFTSNSLNWQNAYMTARKKFCSFHYYFVGGAVAPLLARLNPDRAVRVGILAYHTVVFLGKTLYYHSASLYPGV